MQINNRTIEAFHRVSRSDDGQHIIQFIKDLVTEQSDVRKITDMSVESIKGRQLACTIIEDEILSRFDKEKKKETIIINDEFN